MASIEVGTQCMASIFVNFVVPNTGFGTADGMLIGR